MERQSAVVARDLLFWASVVALVAGLCKLLLGGLPVAAVAGEIFGWLFLALLPLSLGHAAFRKRAREGGATLLCFALGLALLPLAHALASTLAEPTPLPGILIGLFALGPLVVSAFFLARSAYPEVAARRAGPLPSWARLALCLLLLGAALASLLLAWKATRGPEAGLAGVMLPQFLPYWAFSFLALAGLAVRAAGPAPLFRLLGALLALPALAAALLALLPLADTPLVVEAARREFAASFGREASSLRAPGMRRTPFSLGDFFLGTASGPAVEKRDLVYLRERAADGRDYEFRFDAWGDGRPGAHPVVIRVHGGAWVSGDKGGTNMGRMNAYLATRGYAVFDIQYGLSDKGRFSLKLKREPTEGPFGIDDMVRQIGLFSSFLADHAKDYGADVDRVFVSGGSAGGQLVLAAVLATSSGFRDAHAGIGLDPRLRVLGLLPFYPAVGYARGIGVPSTPELDDPRGLIGAAAPPALVYQGGHDGMVAVERVRDFAAAWKRASAAPFALIELPFAGHGSDLLFNGPFNQVFLYYMESFMALELAAKG